MENEKFSLIPVLLAEIVKELIQFDIDNSRFQVMFDKSYVSAAIP